MVDHHKSRADRRHEDVDNIDKIASGLRSAALAYRVTGLGIVAGHLEAAARELEAAAETIFGAAQGIEQ